ncbi:GNAT family N-acetyltransferase [Macrococcus capreoli]|uniref:GNAT family N-acetyltransferase n=1 Tax=Macrococcus capreoli TaxID=2982690 RepID=UPI0021D5F97C|nr:GNAT family N-acetyltransferase [Macrococcus sp. TMW 2.2395]MCU7557668.1 GNAT family N-acetyltransferase [Macrococcus sp. TMW 2.2395]
MINIRQYENKDTIQLIKLYDELGYPSDLNTIKQRLNTILSHNDYHAIVLELNNMIVGFCGFAKMYMFESDQSYIRILAFVIDSDHRGKKLGSKLLKATEDIAIELNAPIVTFNSGNRQERDIAHQFYKNNGYTIKSSGFIKKLSY